MVFPSKITLFPYTIIYFKCYIQYVAEQIDEFIYVKNPPNCVGGIRVIIRASLLIQFILLVYYFLVFYTYK